MDNLFLFTGEETYLLRKQVNAWKQAFKNKHGDLNLITLDPKEVELGQIMTDIEAAPFLADKRLIFIENLPLTAKAKKDEKRDEKLKQLGERLEGIPSSSVVVFIQSNPDKRKSFYKTLVKKAQVKEFKPLAPPALSQWAQEMAGKKGASLSRDSADYLISMVGQSCWRVASEVEKLTTYKQSEPITREDIDHMVLPHPEANVFHFTDALSTKNHRKAIQNLHRSMAAGENLRQVFYMIVRQFRLLLQVKSYQSKYPTTNPTSMASSLKMHPFVARNVLGQIRHFEIQELKQAYSKLLEIDTALKTSGIRITTDDQDQLALTIERFILKFCA